MGKNWHVDYRSAGRHNSNVSRKPPFALRCNDRVITTKNTFRICKWSCSVCGCAVTRIQTIHRVVEINEPDSVRIPWYQTLGCDVYAYSTSRDAHLGISCYSGIVQGYNRSLQGYTSVTLRIVFCKLQA